LNTW
jgi:hypothetical protein